MAVSIRFENLRPPAWNVPLSEIEVEGVRIDLHARVRLVGLTFGIEPNTATLGWAAVEPLQVIRRGRAIPVSGLALHLADLNLFEVAFAAEPPGQLEYFDVHQSKHPALRFFFETGTIRLGCAVCRAELIMDGEVDEDFGPPVPGLVQ